jgi:beta-lactamase regulating signal transducer with metallopeptidase domain
MLALLIEATLKGSLILALAAVVTSLLRGSSAALRHLVWGIALGSAAILPLAARLLPAWNVSVPADIAANLSRLPVATVEPRPASQPAAPRPTGSSLPIAASQGTSLADRGNPPPSPLSLTAALTLGWALVTVLLLARLLFGIDRMARLTRRATPVNRDSWPARLAEAARLSGVARRVRLLASEETTVPLTWGLAHSVVLLPPDNEEWSDERRRAVLIHELAHVARWDYASQLATQICCALYWFNPLIWLAARALRHERERACDDRVLAAGTRASAYAGELLEIARNSLGAGAPGPALAMARRSELEGRLLAILNPRVHREGPRARAAFLFGAGALLLTLPLAAFRVASEPPSPAPRPTSAPLAPRSDGQTRLSVKPAGPNPALAPASRTSSPGAESSPLTVPLACDRRTVKSDHSHSSANWSDSGSKTWRVSWSGDGCSVDLVAKGDVKFNVDFSDVTEISSGGYLEITIREGESTRRLEFRSQGGNLRRTYTVDGSPVPFDDAARAWFAGFLVELDRHTGFAVESRFPALLAKGVSAVLDEIDQIASDYVRGLYYRKLFTSAKLSSSEVRRAAKTAGATMESDYELGRVLASLAEQYSLADAEVRTAFIEAAGTLESDYERAQLLLVVITKGSVTPEAGRTIVRLAGGMSSDYEKARVLMALGGSRLVDPKTAGPEYLDVVVGMKSDYERGRVLKLILGSGQLSRESLLRVLDVTQSMESDYEAANVLIELATRNQVDGVVRDAYLKAADHLKSDYESQRARAALVRS